MAEAQEDDSRGDAANAINEGRDPEGEGPKAAKAAGTLQSRRALTAPALAPQPAAGGGREVCTSASRLQ